MRKTCPSYDILNLLKTTKFQFTQCPLRHYLNQNKLNKKLGVEIHLSVVHISALKVHKT